MQDRSERWRANKGVEIWSVAHRFGEFEREG